MTLWSLFERQAQQRPAAIAVHHDGIDYTYHDVWEGANAFADWLADAGTAPGDRVVLVLPNCVQYITCFLGILKSGRVAVPLNPGMSTTELEAILEDCRPRIVIHGEVSQPFEETIARFRDRVSVPVTVLSVIADRQKLAAMQSMGGNSEPHQSHAVVRNSLPQRLRDLAQILYTSGTTGRPKGVMLSHRNLVSNCQSIVEYLSLGHGDSVLVVLPFFYSYGNSLLITHLSTGGRLVLANDVVFWNRHLDLLEQQRVTGFAGVPSTFAMLLFRSNAARKRFPDLRYLTCAGGGLLPSHVAKVRDLFPSSELFLMYGQTEATARLSTLMPEEIDEKLGSIGRGIPGVSLTILDSEGRPSPAGEVGEIVARGPGIMLGYWNDPEGTRRVLRPEGLRTGDLAFADEEGYLFIIGRNNDMIKSGAYRISPHEIEDVILRNDDVAEVAVVGEPDEMWGEIPVAFVVPASDRELNTEQILESCRRSLPHYKQPRKVRVVETLPRTASGKVRRCDLREALTC